MVIDTDELCMYKLWASAHILSNLVAATKRPDNWIRSGQQASVTLSSIQVVARWGGSSTARERLNLQVASVGVQ